MDLKYWSNLKLFYYMRRKRLECHHVYTVIWLHDAVTNQSETSVSESCVIIWLNFWDEIEEKNKRLFNGMLDKDQFKDVFWSVVLRCVLCEGHPGFHWRVLTERYHKKSCVLCKQAEHNMMCNINKPSTYMRWVKFELFPPVDWCYPWVLQTKAASSTPFGFEM